MGKGTGFVWICSHSSGGTVPSLEARETALSYTTITLAFTQLPLLTLLALSAAESVHEQDSIQSNYSSQQLPGVLLGNISSIGRLFAIKAKNTAKTETSMIQIQK